MKNKNQCSRENVGGRGGRGAERRKYFELRPPPASPPACLASLAIPALLPCSKNGLGPVGGKAIRESLSSLTALACLDIGCAAFAPAAPPVITVPLARTARRPPHHCCRPSLLAFRLSHSAPSPPSGWFLCDVHEIARYHRLLLPPPPSPIAALRRLAKETKLLYTNVGTHPAPGMAGIEPTSLCRLAPLGSSAASHASLRLPWL